MTREKNLKRGSVATNRFSLKLMQGRNCTTFTVVVIQMPALSTLKHEHGINIYAICIYFFVVSLFSYTIGGGRLLADEALPRLPSSGKLSSIQEPLQPSAAGSSAFLPSPTRESAEGNANKTIKQS